MSDFTSLGIGKLVSIAAHIRAAERARDGEEFLAVLELIDQSLGDSAPVDPAIDDFRDALDALRGNDRPDIVADWEEENEGDVLQISWVRFLRLLALDELTARVDGSIELLRAS